MVVEVALAAVAVAALAFAYLDRRASDKARSAERREWDSERQWLLNRIQHPQVYQPVREAAMEAMANDGELRQVPDDPEYDAVGTINLNGNEDEPDAA